MARGLTVPRLLFGATELVGKRSDRANWCACIGARPKHRIDLFAEKVEPDPLICSPNANK